MPNENLRTDLAAVLVMAASSVLKCYTLTCFTLWVSKS